MTEEERASEAMRLAHNEILSLRAEIKTLNNTILALQIRIEQVQSIWESKNVEIERLRASVRGLSLTQEPSFREMKNKLDHIAKHPDTPPLIKQYAAGKLDG